MASHHANHLSLRPGKHGTLMDLSAEGLFAELHRSAHHKGGYGRIRATHDFCFLMRPQSDRIGPVGMARLWRTRSEWFLPLLFVAIGGCDKTAVWPGVAGSTDGGAAGNVDVRLSDQDRIDSESRGSGNEFGNDVTDAEPPDELRTDAPGDDQDSGTDGRTTFGVDACTKEEDCAAGPCVSGICDRWPTSQCSSDSECASGFCAQGVCCDSACQGPCVSCNLAQHVGICSPVPSGTPDPKASCVDEKVSSCGTTGRCDGAGGCQRYSSTSICRAASCAAGVQTSFGVCDGLGSCIAGQQSVCPWGCADGAARCSRGCPSGDSICIDGSYCSGDEECRAKKQDGPCSSDHECLSGFCAQGVCCASMCVGPCFACNQAGTAGTCARIANPDASLSCPAFL